jgi:hypothetical protein
MIRVNVSETFSLTATLIDEVNGVVSTGNTVFYDVRQQPDDIPLSPILYGTLLESIVIPGIYTTILSIDKIGTYVAYITCLGFISYAERIIVSTISGVPKLISGGFGAINMTMNNNNVRMSTKPIIPIMNTSIRV